LSIIQLFYRMQLKKLFKDKDYNAMVVGVISSKCARYPNSQLEGGKLSPNSKKYNSKLSRLL
jgi:hypothetical protein